jgi:hypothetical protein
MRKLLKVQTKVRVDRKAWKKERKGYRLKEIYWSSKNRKRETKS